MERYLNEVMRYLVTQSGQIALLTLAVAGITFTLRQRSAHLRYLLWLIVLAKCLVPPLYVAPLRVLPGADLQAVPAGSEAEGNGVSSAAAPVSLNVFDPQPYDPVSRAAALPVRKRLSPLGLLGVVWVGGAGVYLAMNLLRVVRGYGWLRRRRGPLPDSVHAEITDILRLYGISRLPPIWVVEDISQPFVWGLLRGSIYLPAHFFRIGTPQQRRDVLAHELSHVLRFDAGINIFQVLAQGLFWFHPLVWWAGRRIRKEREKCCDEMVIARMGTEPRSYSHAIVEALSVARRAKGFVPSLAIAGPARNIEERIRTMLQPGRRFHQRPSLGAAVCALLLALLLVPTTLALTRRPVGSPDSATQQAAAEGTSGFNVAQRTLSADNLKKLGLALTMHAMDRGGKYPENLMSLLGGYIAREEVDRLAGFISNDAEYLGANKTRREDRAFDTPLAYDLTLLRQGTGTNVVFADGHVAFVSGVQLDKYGIALPKSRLEIVSIQFEPIHQGKNVVHVIVKNGADAEQVFAAHIYTRSPDYGRPSPNPSESGVGWGTGGYFEALKPGETRPLRLVFKIQGPVTARTYVNLRFYNPEAQDKYEYKRYFERRAYASADLEKARTDSVTQAPASSAETQAVTQTFTAIQNDLRNGRYPDAWERFTKDYQKAEYQMGFEWFRRAMEPTHPMHSAFTWERAEFLKLRPGQVVKSSKGLTLGATLDGQTWSIDFVRDHEQWKLDWIAGYVPAIIRPQEENRPASADVGSNMTMPDQPPASATQAGNLEVRNIHFDAIRRGKNALHIEVRNRSQTEQTFGVDIRTEFPPRNWQKQLFETVKGGVTRTVTFDFEILGAIADGASIRLRFYNPPSRAAFDVQSWFQERRYTFDELPIHEEARGPAGPVTPAEKDAVTTVFGQFQRSLQEQDYPAAWNLTSGDFRSSFQNDIGRFRAGVSSEEARKAFAALRPESVTRLGTLLTLRVSGDSHALKLHFVQENGQWKIDQAQEDRGSWEKRLLPTLAQRSTEHFDIYYFKDSTAAKEIEQIVRQKEEGFRQICQFLGQDSKTRMRIVLFEDGITKQRETGHQGAGWAYGNTIVEVYNEKEKLDPYHETTHILMGPFGHPPALFNEGFATYMVERLGGKATLYQCAKELKNKGEWIELPELLGYTEIGSAKSRPTIAYPEAASFVKFLIDIYGKDKFLQAYRALRNSSEANIRAGNVKTLEDIYGQPLQTLQREWEALLARS